MNSKLSSASVCFGLYENNNIVGFLAVLHFPHPKRKKIKHVHRLVLLPEYQGIGLGVRFLESVANLYDDFDFTIITTLRGLGQRLKKSPNWALCNYGKNSRQHATSTLKGLTKRHRINTYSFRYKNKKVANDTATNEA